MEHIRLIGAVALATVAMLAPQASANSASAAAGKIAALEQRHQEKALPAPQMWKNGEQVATPKAYDPAATLEITGGWGFIEGTDGSQWYYTMETTTANWYYTSAKTTIYNSAHEKVSSFDIELPASTVNAVQLLGPITTTMFDTDASTQEVIVYIHAAGSADNNYQGAYWTRVYSLDGTLLIDYNLYGYLLDFRPSGSTSVDYLRLMLVDYDTQDSTEYEQYKIYHAPQTGDSIPVLEHTFSLPAENLYYCEGSPLNVYNIDGDGYYVLSQYAKPYTDGYDSNYEMIIAEDNYYTMVSYDMSYNKIDSIAVSTDAPTDAYCRMLAFGMMSSYDLSKNYFTTDGKLAYVVTIYDYILSSDDYRYAFEVYDSGNSLVNTVCDKVYNTWGYLKDIDGQSQQMMFMRVVDDDEMVQMIDVPSCENATCLPAYINGELITTDLNRYQYGNSYQYVVKLSYATSDSDGNVIARLGWYNTDITLDHYTQFNLGPNGEYFRPLLSDVALDPYLINTSNELEFLYMAKIQRADTTLIDDILVIAAQDGSTIKSFDYDESKGDLYTAYVLTDALDDPELAVVYRLYNSGSYTYNLEFYTLPMTKFQGGTGTAADPYLIESVGDLLEISSDVTAHYKLVDDIDMSTYSGTWAPVQSFSGSLDGDGHYINGLSIEASDYYCGMFGLMSTYASISNLTLINPTVKVQSGNGYVGTIAGSCRYDTLANVHVVNGLIEAESGMNPTVGGLVGLASLYTQFSGSSYDGTIYTPGAGPAGGIVGDTRTTATVSSSATSGAITAASEVGGIVGTSSRSVSVTNCHSSMDVSGSYYVGGIMGYNGYRGPITNCHFTGSVTGTTPNKWTGYLNLGGIVGYLEPDWSSSSSKIVSGCVSTGNIYGPDTITSDATVHRIAGYTIANYTYSEGEETGTEAGIANCCGLATATLLGSTVTSSDSTSVEGFDIAADALTTDLFTNIGYEFGDTDETPWKATSGIPVLYFEDNALALTLSYSALAVPLEGTELLVATVYGTDASAIGYSVDADTIASLSVSGQEGGQLTLSVSGIALGTATITITAGDYTLYCPVTVFDEEVAGIIETLADGQTVAIVAADGCITAHGASKVTVYSVNGSAVRTASGCTVDTTGLTAGIYIVAATDSAGRATTAKVVVK